MIVALALATCTCILSLASAYPSYDAFIPNGQKVPDPCQPGTIWTGVGHIKEKGTGPLNVFGAAFAAEGHVWTTALCNADSDRDGASNGVELGDPNCQWSIDNPTSLQTPTSHPGVCEPIGSTNCNWQTFTC